MNLTQKVKEGVDNLRTYWKTPPKGRHMNFREIAAYSGGGIGAYMIISIGTACILSTNNVILSSVLGIAPMDMYVMYVIAVVSNIFLTGIRANIIDNTRNKAGKYRPYIVSMAIPAAVIAILTVWFPYDKFGALFGEGEIFGESKAYISKCAIVMVLNLAVHFFYYFFYEAYDNLIHVLSPNSIERSDVAGIKSVVYSLAPSIINMAMPLVAQHVFKTNLNDIRPYRLVYPILAVGGILLCIIVYKYTEEKIVQARTHVVQIKFTDSLRAVAKNKYFWIISLASWIGFLEGAYSNIMYWLYTYGGACSGNAYSLIVTLYGNASLWGMLAAPFCIRKWGKKAVLVVTNLFNIVCILAMILFVDEITPNVTIWLVFSCLWINALMGSFAHILNPAIQADIRDYQQYITGERIDGMFSVVNTMGTVLALGTSSVLPFIYAKGGINSETAHKVLADPNVLNRHLLSTGKTVADTLAEQAAAGQEVYNDYASLYDLNILSSILKVLIVVAAVGALMNVIPFFWYDFNERKQKSIVRVLRVRALFEDYANGIVGDAQLVEGIDIIRKAREMFGATPKSEKKADYKSYKEVAKDKSYKNVTDKAERKLAKKDYKEKCKLAKKECKKALKEAVEFNEEIEVAKFVCDELDKFSTPAFQYQYSVQSSIYKAGLAGLKTVTLEDAKAEYAKAKAMPKTNDEEKAIRKATIEIARVRKSAVKSLAKYYSDAELVQPDFADLEKLFDAEDACDAKLKELYLALKDAKKAKADNVKEIKAEIKAYEAKKEETRKATKAEMDKHAYFARAAKPYLDAEKLVKQEENYKHFDEIAEQYEEAKARKEQAEAEAEEKARIEKAEREAHAAQLKAEKAAKKAEKKANK